MRRQMADHLVVVMKRSNVHGAKEVGHPRWNHNGPTGNRRSPQVLVEGGSSQGWHESCDGRLSSTDLRGARGEIPSAYSAFVFNLEKGPEEVRRPFFFVARG